MCAGCMHCYSRGLCKWLEPACFAILRGFACRHVRWAHALLFSGALQVAGTRLLCYPERLCHVCWAHALLFSGALQAAGTRLLCYPERLCMPSCALGACIAI